MGKFYIDAEDLIKNMEAGCIPIHEKGISGILGDESCIKDYIDKAVRVDLVQAIDFRNLQKRFNHLLLSDFIHEYDEVDPKTGRYRKDIKEVDNLFSNISKKHSQKRQVVVRTYTSEKSSYSREELVDYLERGYTVVMGHQLGEGIEYILEKVED